MPSATTRQPTESQSIPVHDPKTISPLAVSDSKFSPMKRASLLRGQHRLQAERFAIMRIAALRNQYSGTYARPGHVLALRANASGEDPVVPRVCAPPPGLEDTRISLTPSMPERLAQGHQSSLKATPIWDLPTLAGAGAPLRPKSRDRPVGS
jgi:hypothetical protein